MIALRKSILAVSATLTLMLLAASCGKSKAEIAIENETAALNEAATQAVADAPALIASASATPGQGTVDLTVSFTDAAPDFAQLSRPVLDFFLSQFLKANPGKALDSFINSLSAAKYKLSVNLVDSKGYSVTADYTAAQLARLLQASPAQLGFNNTKAWVMEQFQQRVPRMIAVSNVTNGAFDLEHGFATYILYYPNYQLYKNTTAGNLMARYIPVLKEDLNRFGTFAPIVEATLKTLGIDGFRFVCSTGQEKGYELRATIPWREIK